jgi:hypothetical protein
MRETVERESASLLRLCEAVTRKTQLMAFVELSRRAGRGRR